MNLHKGNPLIKINELTILLEKQIENLPLNVFWLIGEVQNLRDTGGHLYFNLFDNRLCINSIIWNKTKTDNNIKLENGYKGKFLGKINLYKNKNTINFIIYKIELEGIGNLYHELEITKQYCLKNKFFDKPKKNINNIDKALLITRYNSAAYNDILHSIKDCFNLKLYILDSSMQGNNSIEEIITNIDLAEKLKTKLKLDAIILSRGGGSIDDLWVFNNKKIIEKIYQCNTPFITAIGHDIDHCLCDDISDKSFITPTELGKYINSMKGKSKKIEQLSNLKSNLNNIIETKIEQELDILNQIVDEIDIDNIINNYNNKIIYLNQFRNKFKKNIIDNIDNKIKNLDEVANEFDSENIITNYHIKIRKLYNYKNQFQDKFANKIKHEIILLDKLLLECKEYIHSKTSLSLFDKSNNEIIDNKMIQENDTYYLKFNNEKFKIKVIKKYK